MLIIKHTDEGVVDLPYKNAFALVASSLASNTQNAIGHLANTQNAILQSITGGGACESREKLNQRLPEFQKSGK